MLFQFLMKSLVCICVLMPFELCNDCFDWQSNIYCLEDLISCLKTTCEITIHRQKILIFFYYVFFIIVCYAYYNVFRLRDHRGG